MKLTVSMLGLLCISTLFAQDARVDRRQAVRDSIRQSRENRLPANTPANPAVVPVAAAQSPLPPQTTGASGQQLTASAVLPIADSVIVPSLNVRETEIRDLLQGLAVQYGLNLVMAADVKGPVTANFTNQPLRDVLKIILEQNGYEFVVSHGTITIRRFVPPPPPVPKEPVRRFEVQWDNNKLSLDVEKASLEQIIRALVERTGKTIVREPGADGELTLLLKGVELNKGLELIARGLGLALRENGGIFTVYREAWNAAGNTGSGQGNKAWVRVEADSSVSLEASETALSTILSSLFNQAGINTVVYGKLEGNVTARIEKIPLREALKFMLRGTSYTFWEKGGVYFIGPHEMQTSDNSMLIRLRHLRAEDVVKLLPSTLTRSTQIQVVRSQNALMAVGSYEILDAIQQYVEKMDLPVPQILIEALVVDVNMSKARSYGVDLLLGDASKVGSAETLYPNFEQVLNRNQSQSVLDKAGIGDVVRLPKNFVAKVRALEQQKMLDVKARSQIATLNGETAVLTIGQTQYFLLKSETDYNQGVGVTNKTTERFEKVEANATLTVTPYVTGAREVTCEIIPDFSEPEGSFDSRVPPTLNKRYVKSSVRLRDGETIVLGGMVKESVNEVHRQVPFLGSIPYLGWLFKNVEKVTSRSQLLIFVTPRIYYGDEGNVEVDAVLKGNAK